MAVAPIGAIGLAVPAAIPSPTRAAQPAPPVSGTGFGDLLASGLANVDAKVAKADGLMKAYALGETVPVHQVTIALEEARVAVELAVQVRERLSESYRSFMNMQL